jgi:hypothetical protein
MGKSLTEVAKAILMNESNDSEPDRGAKSSNPNMATLKPGGGSKGGVEPSPMSNQATLVADAPKKPGEGENVGAKAATMKQDTSQASPSRKGAVPAQPPEKMMEEDVELDEEDYLEEDSEFEMTEELQAFIDEMIEEGYDEDQIAQAIEENFEFVTEDLDEETEEVPYYDYEVDMNEDIQALFAGEDLSEEFMNKAKTIFEAAVVAKMQSEIARLEEAYAATLEEEVETIKESLAENVDDYLNYVVENWVSENEVAIEAGLRTELTEDFISGLRQLFAEHYIDIPEDQVSVVEEMGSKIEELEIKLNEEIERNVELTNILSESVKNEIINNMTDGLTVTQAEKLKSLSEGVEFVDEESFATKIQTLRENYFPSNVKTQTELDIIVPGTEGQTMISEESNPMNKYVRALGKTLPN